MKKEEIYLGDWQRILFGDTPGEFTWEVLVRTVLIYLIFLVVMRLLGKRMNAQLTITELAVMLTLGAIVSVPMQTPNRGMIPAVLLLLCVLFFQRGSNWWAFKQRKVEAVLQGNVTLLAKNGVLLLDKLKEERVSHEQLYAQLRDQKITQLGQVKRAYMEADGTFSIFQQEPPVPGLSVLPDLDQRLRRSQETVDSTKACRYCGTVATPQSHTGTQCPNCHHDDWTPAVR
ncbi:MULTISPECIES: DUF421 domain-containing protein [Hymenobacter]|uniref:YetF C-terminal domain-containing protein n=1 Tax=Hymenobacter mucosus TaxID=1411120 RepID=A0A238XZ10_9BACT|nr:MULTISPECIES: YetF domain-containing protein [Hymenobacter]SNR64215.1 Protein of unknown function [Hymenobacter mucosus]